MRMTAPRAACCHAPQTCVGAEWGDSCEGVNLLQIIRLLSTCVIDLQLYHVARALLTLWRQVPSPAP